MAAVRRTHFPAISAAHNRVRSSAFTRKTTPNRSAALPGSGVAIRLRGSVAVALGHVATWIAVRPNEVCVFEAPNANCCPTERACFDTRCCPEGQICRNPDKLLCCDFNAGPECGNRCCLQGQFCADPSINLCCNPGETDCSGRCVNTFKGHGQSGEHKFPNSSVGYKPSVPDRSISDQHRRPR
jgi:hypothetical protein